MRVVVDTLVPNQTALVCGSVIHYQEGGPVRFVQIEIPWDLFSWAVLAAIYEQVNAAMDHEPVEDTLF